MLHLRVESKNPYRQKHEGILVRKMGEDRAPPLPILPPVAQASLLAETQPTVLPVAVPYQGGMAGTPHRMKLNDEQGRPSYPTCIPVVRSFASSHPGNHQRLRAMATRIGSKPFCAESGGGDATATQENTSIPVAGVCDPCVDAGSQTRPTISTLEHSTPYLKL